MNKVILIGNQTKDPELTYTAGTGSAVCKFTIAISRGYKDKNETDFINCVCFGKVAENVAQYTAKGSKLCVEGQIRVNQYKDKEGNNRYSTEIITNNVEFLTRANNSEEGSRNVTMEVSNSLAGFDGIEPIEDGDMPF